MFVDKVNVIIQAGKGGDGKVSFRHEIYVDKGGPDGGDGGDGGDVVVRASRNQNTLAAFRYQKLVKAEDGKSGEKRKRHGKSGTALVVDLPVGTVVTQDAEVVVDLVEDGQEAIIAKGGKGGFGNAHFTSSTRQAPRIAEKGEQPEELQLTFELKMIADVGLIGLPNAGKSTLLSVISNARPEIANYPFTTLTPNLGVVDIADHQSLLFADIPGLIEGASEGKGLGDEFLRHVERTGALVQLIDAYDDNVAASFKVVDEELRSYSKALAEKPRIIALNKTEGLDQEIIDDLRQQLTTVMPKKTTLLVIAAQAKQGLDSLLFEVAKMVETARAVSDVVEDTVSGIQTISLAPSEEDWHVTKKGDTFVITGPKIERFAGKTDFENPHGVQRLRDIMRKMGIVHELDRQGITFDDEIHIGKHIFRY